MVSNEVNKNTGLDQANNYKQFRFVIGGEYYPLNGTLFFLLVHAEQSWQ